jgi:hypothetical protein
MAGPVRPRDWLFALALVAAVFLVYQPAWRGGFILDDDTHLLNNPVLRPGGVLRTWVPGAYIAYWPLTFTVYWAEYRLWGPAPLGFHLVNIALHALSALLVWRILALLRVPGALLGAALFALHPVNVESVAWIAQLKNTLSLALTLLSVLFYLLASRSRLPGGTLGGAADLAAPSSARQAGPTWWYVGAVAAFALATLAKGMTLTLPAVLLACAWWQRGRIERRDLRRVVPFVLIATTMAVMEVYQQHVSAQQTVVRSDGLLSRAAVAGCAVWFYLGKLIWPADLTFIYARWNLGAVDAWWLLPGALLAAVRRNPERGRITGEESGVRGFAERLRARQHGKVSPRIESPLDGHGQQQAGEHGSDQPSLFAAAPRAGGAPPAEKLLGPNAR